MKKKKVEEIYPEFVEKYKDFPVDSYKLKMIETECRKKYREKMKIHLEQYIRLNLHFEVQAQLYKNIEKLNNLHRYKGLVVRHSKDITKYLSEDEIDIIFDDTIDYIKDIYDGKEVLGSCIVRNFKNALIEYVNDYYNGNFEKVNEDKYKIKRVLKK